MAVLSHSDELPVRGDLLKWAREAQGLTLRQVQDRKGPSPAYQSEVERGHKFEVRSQVLIRWMRVLNVSEPFVRGRINRYREAPAECRGLARAVREKIHADQADYWKDATPTERLRHVLRLIPETCPDLTPVVLAYVMYVELDTLLAMMQGHQVIAQPVKNMVLELTLLNDYFLKHGEVGEHAEDQAELVPYREPVLLCRQLGIGPKELLHLIKRLTNPDGEDPTPF